MKIRIRDQIYDAENEPVMVILSPSDKENIANMLPEATQYCCFPDGMDPEKIKKWMKEETSNFSFHIMKTGEKFEDAVRKIELPLSGRCICVSEKISDADIRMLRRACREVDQINSDKPIPIMGILPPESEKEIPPAMIQCSCGWISRVDDLLWQHKKTTFDHIRDTEGIAHPAAIKVDMEGGHCPRCKKMILERYAG